MTNNKYPLVTIGIPTYNRADGFLKKALQSAVEQTYKNLEIIVSDNCSTDHTESLVDDFSDTRIRYVKHPMNIGANNNFNFCVDNAKGEYFLLLHDDDLIDPDFIETCMSAVRDDVAVGVIFTGSRVIDKNANILWETPNRGVGLSTTDFFLSWFSEQTALYLCSTLFNTKRLQELGGFRSKTNHFQDVVAEVILAAKYGRTDVYDVKASFRKHDDNMGGNWSSVKAWCEDSLYLLDIMCGLKPEYKKIIFQKGTQYFFIKHYRLASTIKPFIQLLKAYLTGFWLFGYKYSQLRFIYSKDIKPVMKKLKRKLRRKTW